MYVVWQNTRVLALVKTCHGIPQDRGKARTSIGNLLSAVLLSLTGYFGLAWTQGKNYSFLQYVGCFWSLKWSNPVRAAGSVRVIAARSVGETADSSFSFFLLVSLISEQPNPSEEISDSIRTQYQMIVNWRTTMTVFRVRVK